MLWNERNVCLYVYVVMSVDIFLKLFVGMTIRSVITHT